MLKPLGRLIFNMGIAIPGNTVFLIETAPSITLSISEYQFESRTVTSCAILDAQSQQPSYTQIERR